MTKQATFLYNKKPLYKKAKFCDTFLSRILGLMLSRPRAAILKANRESIQASSIHTFFMRFPLDVIWLDKNMKVVDLKRNVKPYRLLVAPRKKAMYVIEAPCRDDLKIAIGKRLEIRF